MKCSIKHCKRNIHAKGYCNTHYEQIRCAGKIIIKKCACGCDEILDNACTSFIKGHKPNCKSCACGCGKKTASYSTKYIRGHNAVGRVFSEETKNKISKSKIGKNTGTNNPNFGRPISEKLRKLLSKIHSGKIISESHKMAISKTHKGKKKSLKTIKKMRASARKGKDSHFWNGGTSCSPYGKDWTRFKRDLVKFRDNYTCKNSTCRKNSTKLTVHHIDYDKTNCTIKNLVTLCGSCNARANFKREHWERKYNLLLKNSITYKQIYNVFKKERC